MAHTTNASTSSAVAMEAFSGEMALGLIFYSLLMVTVLVGNGLIIGAFVYNFRLRTVTNILVIGLSSADFLVGSISIPTWMRITVNQFNNTKLDFYAYQFYITADIFIGTASILQLTCISIERCHAVMAPIQHRLMSRRVFYATVGAVWLFSGCIAGLQPLQYQNWESVYTLLTATICFFIPAAVILVAYVCIFRRARGGPSLTRHRSSHAVFARELRLSLTVCLITVLFVLAWLPLFGITLVATYNPSLLPDPMTSQRVIAFAKWMHYSSSAINPFFYSYRNNDLRKSIKVMIKKFFLRKHVRLDDLNMRSRTNSIFSFRSSTSFSFGRKNSRSQRPTSVSSQQSDGSRQQSRKKSNDTLNNNNNNKNVTEQAI